MYLHIAVLYLLGGLPSRISGILSNARNGYLNRITSLSTTVTGSVTLVGAGPGDPDLLTLGALKLLQTASLVVADRLISPEILSLVSCELKVANKRPGCAEEAQDEIFQWVISAARAGKHVVRLKIGDPFLFGRGGEEILEFRRHGIPVSVAPGLSSSYAAPLAALIPLTHRNMSSQVLICTGFLKDAMASDVPEFAPDRTIVFLMGIGRIKEIMNDLINRNHPGSVPVAIIESATTPRERFAFGTIDTIANIAAREEMKAPAIIVIGQVVNVLRVSPNSLNQI